MKQGKKKHDRDETSVESPGGDIVGSDNRNNPKGIDGIKALMVIAGGIATLVLGWLILHNILHII
jgi:hypothetical protein